MTAIPTGALRSSWRRFALAIGPGVVVMLADTDAGSVITAAQSGAEWGYRLLGLQFAMIPLLYAMQELTIRLGLGTQRGFVNGRIGQIGCQCQIRGLQLILLHIRLGLQRFNLAPVQAKHVRGITDS